MGLGNNFRVENTELLLIVIKIFIHHKVIFMLNYLNNNTI